WFGIGYNPSIPRDAYYPRTPALEWLQRDTSIFRVLGGGATLVPNTAEVFGLSDVRGCDFMSVRRYEELVTGGAGDFFFYRDAPRFPDGFAFLNVKYVLTSEPALANSEQFELVYSDEIFIYRYKECRDRALVVFDYQVEHDPAAVLSRVRSGTFEPTDFLLLE